MATKIKHLKVGGTTYDLAATTADSMGEANLTWGGKNFSGSFGPIDAAMIPRLGANRFAFAEPGGITVEYSTNGGSTWTDYGATDAQKLSLTSTGNIWFTVGKRTAAGTSTVNDQLRITFDTHLCGIYSELNKFCISLSTEGSTGCTCTIDIATHAAPTNFVTVTTADVGGWSGYNIINTNKFTTYGNSDNQYQKVRFTFKISGVNTSYKGLTIFSISAFGGMGWSTPSSLARNGDMYTYDEYQNVTFPKQVTATQFNGNATGLVDAGNGSQITANYSASGMPYSSVSWLAAWNGYSLQSISKDEFVGNNADSVSAALNKLNSGNATPSGADYYICQSANGGTTDTTYYRRPVSALWNYIKGQSDNVYVAKGTIATTSAAGLMSSDDKSKLDGIAAGANNYSLPNASSSTLGGVKIGDNITCSLGTISLTKANVTNALGYTPPTTNSTYTIATSTTAGLVKPYSVIARPSVINVDSTGSYYAVQMSSDGLMFVNVPSKTYSAGLGIVISPSGSIRNSGVRSVSTGSTNGTIKVDTDGTTTSVSVKGLGSAAYTSSSNYASSGHTHSTFDNNVEITSGHTLDVRSIKTYDSWLGSTTSTGSYGNVLKCGSSGRLYWGTDDDTTTTAASSNSTEKLFLVGTTEQSSSGKTTYSNSSCYASGGYLYSNGKKVDMDSISGGVEWGTF